jgi:hypothetical protein
MDRGHVVLLAALAAAVTIAAVLWLGTRDGDSDTVLEKRARSYRVTARLRVDGVERERRGSVVVHTTASGERVLAVVAPERGRAHLRLGRITSTSWAADGRSFAIVVDSLSRRRARAVVVRFPRAATRASAARCSVTAEARPHYRPTAATCSLPASC